MSGPVSARTSSAALRLQPGIDSGLGQLLLVRGQQFQLRYAGYADVDAVDAAQHGLEQSGVLAG
jgi:hypothetical protein